MAEGCVWAAKSPILQEFHDLEWGHPVVDAQELFEKLCLQCLSTGTSKTESTEGFVFDLGMLAVIEARGLYREKFCNFIPEEMIKLSAKDIDAIVESEKQRDQKNKESENENNFKGLCKNKQKLKALLTNAKAYLKMMEEGVDFSEYCWSFTNNKMILGAANTNDIPTCASNMSADMKKRGFSYTTPSVCYGFMQTVGMINEHGMNCPKRNECTEEARIFGK